MTTIWQDLADHHGFTARQLAAILGVAPSSAHRLLRGERHPRGETLQLLTRVLALGAARPGEECPLFVLVLVAPDGDLGGYLPDDQLRPAVFSDRANGLAVADLLRRFGIENIAVVPMWGEHVDALFTARTGKHPLRRAFEDRTFTLDAGDHEHQRRQLVRVLARTIEAEEAAQQTTA